MSIKSLLAKPFANYIYKKIIKEAKVAVDKQDIILKQLVQSAKKTVFGKGATLGKKIFGQFMKISLKKAETNKDKIKEKASEVLKALTNPEAQPHTPKSYKENNFKG